jgi:hypothetical protein
VLARWAAGLAALAGAASAGENAANDRPNDVQRTIPNQPAKIFLALSIKTSIRTLCQL